ncbi:hypothetical protein C8J56DRAFT_1046127 [Mycena floridula]|nr:hypothetical protein C8J56DRAFT_1046127 [Mycena floridula]
MSLKTFAGYPRAIQGFQDPAFSPATRKPARDLQTGQGDDGGQLVVDGGASARPFQLRCLKKYASYLLQTIRDEGRLAILEALKGSSGLLSSISRSTSQILSVNDTDTALLHTEVVELYVDLLNQITIYLIHPPVMRRCCRRLQRNEILSKTEDLDLKPLAAGHEKWEIFWEM